jgi:hypothetical protein
MGVLNSRRSMISDWCDGCSTKSGEMPYSVIESLRALGMGWIMTVGMVGRGFYVERVRVPRWLCFWPGGHGVSR